MGGWEMLGDYVTFGKANFQGQTVSFEEGTSFSKVSHVTAQYYTSHVTRISLNMIEQNMYINIYIYFNR